MKNNLLQILGTFVATVVASLVVFWLTQPNDLNDIEVKVNSFNVPPKAIEAIEEFAVKEGGRWIANPDQTEMRRLIMSFHTDFAFAEIQLINNSDRKSKQIEIKIPQAVVAIVTEKHGYSENHTSIDRANLNSINIDSIDPGATVRLFTVSNRRLFEEKDIRILHGGKFAPIDNVKKDFSDDPLGIVELFYDTLPFSGLALLLMCLFILSFLFGLIPFAVAYSRSVPFAARSTKKEEVERWLKIISYLKEHAPEKVPNSICECSTKI